MRTTRKKNTKNKKTLKIFKSVDYKSNDGMLTTIWGPCIWNFLHTMSFNYPVQPTYKDKREYRQFVLSLEQILPCKKCRKNLHNNFAKLPLKKSDMKSRYTFSLYIYRLHELINKMLQKESGLTYKDVQERYEHFRARCVLPFSKSSTEKITTTNTKHPKENGCVEPLYGEKAKCELHIVPVDKKGETLQIDAKCIKKRLIL
jgi:hypothetical protein